MKPGRRATDERQIGSRCGGEIATSRQCHRTGHEHQNARVDRSTMLDFIGSVLE
jgi:hypothetical protein